MFCVEFKWEHPLRIL